MKRLFTLTSTRRLASKKQGILGKALSRLGAELELRRSGTHRNLTSLAPQERLPELPIIPRVLYGLVGQAVCWAQQMVSQSLQAQVSMRVARRSAF